jgi:hypothetical protein
MQIERATYATEATRVAVAQFERIKARRAAKPECDGCGRRPATKFRIFERYSLIIGLCGDCEGAGGSRRADRLAAEGRRCLDESKARLERLRPRT